MDIDDGVIGHLFSVWHHASRSEAPRLPTLALPKRNRGPGACRHLSPDYANNLLNYLPNR